MGKAWILGRCSKFILYMTKPAQDLEIYFFKLLLTLHRPASVFLQEYTPDVTLHLVYILFARMVLVSSLKDTGSLGMFQSTRDVLSISYLVHIQLIF